MAIRYGCDVISLLLEKEKLRFQQIDFIVRPEYFNPVHK